MICDQCQGSGKVPVSKHNGITVIESLKQCPKCVGTGKVDWIENVVGKRKPFTQLFQEIMDVVADATLGEAPAGTGMTRPDKLYVGLSTTDPGKEQ